MRDIPGLFWILSVFFILGIGTLVYARMGPKEIAPGVTVWEKVERFRNDIRSRQNLPAAGALQSEAIPPYEIHRARLKGPDPATGTVSYSIKILPLPFHPRQDRWVEGGIEVGLVDFAPQESVGDVRLVAVKKFQAND